jgi:SAM-dependent methyltransferase
MTGAVSDSRIGQETALAARQFRTAYAAQRAWEGRAYEAAELDVLPYLTSGPLARQWSVRARSYDALVREVFRPATASRDKLLSILDLGAGCGWLCRRAALAGHTALALDVRDDCVDGLGAAAHYLKDNRSMFARVVASFDVLPLAPRQFDVAIFNASIHYALDLGAAVLEAARVVRPGGQLVILDSPFYADEADGAAMVAEKRRNAASRYGERAQTLMAPPFVEFLTAARLAAVPGIDLVWRRHRVRYPVWYEARPMVARLHGRRQPSRFDLWECLVP